MSGCLVVERSDTCVGLMLLWQEDIQVTLRSYSDWHIDVEVNDGSFVFRFTGLYGASAREKKQTVWDILDTLKGQTDLPWLLGGDLNEILDMSEKDGGRRRHRENPFRFDACWADDQQCAEKVTATWGQEGISILGKVQSVRDKLGKWQIYERRDAVKRKNALKARIDQLMMMEISKSTINELQVVKEELMGLLDNEERYWRQRSHKKSFCKSESTYPGEAGFRICPTPFGELCSSDR
ncbi:hypothetical protein V6N13_049191 [Hibiscus sabdariffa]